MRRILAGSLPLLLVALSLIGCAGRRCTCASSPPGTAGGNTLAPWPTETRTERGVLSPDLAMVASYEAVDQALSPLPVQTQYRVLRAEEVQCLAAANSPLGKIYDAESRAVLNTCSRRAQCSAPTLSCLMAFRAVDERNKSAGRALELFYGLAEAEAGRDILMRTVEKIDHALANLDELKRSGLEIPLDPSLLQRQKLDWLDQHVQAQSTVHRLQGQLRQLCGYEGDGCTAIWPQADLTVTVTPIDAQAAIAEGLENRADVNALRMLENSTDAGTMPAARAGIQAMSPGLGVSMAAGRLLGGDAVSEEELHARQSQVSEARREAERNASREIDEAVSNVETRLREIAVAKERFEVWQHRCEGLEQKRPSGGVSAFDITAAQLEMLRAEYEVLHRVVAWKVALAKLKQAQGLLAIECGSRLPCRYR